MDRQKDTILVVDDNAVNLEVMQAVLSRAGYETTLIDDSKACLEMLKTFTPDLILLDINMPGLNGLEVCKLLQLDPKTCEIPIIFVTGMTDNKTIKDAFEAGCTDYVEKPINRDEFLARIKSVLARQKYKASLLEREKLTGVLEMAGAVCHELNQPLQSIQFYIDAISPDSIEDIRIRKTLEQIKQQAVRMGKITRKIMQITKYESIDYLGGVRIIDIEKASNSRTMEE
jgi:CheY-like chemotaxis protein